MMKEMYHNTVYGNTVKKYRNISLYVFSVSWHPYSPALTNKRYWPRCRLLFFVFLIGPKNTNLVENVEIMLPVKFCWIPFSGSEEKLKMWKNNDDGQTDGRQTTHDHNSAHEPFDLPTLKFWDISLETHIFFVWA